LTTEIDDVYGYVLYTTDDLSSIQPVANREGSIPPSTDNYNYYRYNAAEWSEWGDSGLYEEVNEILEYLIKRSTLSFHSAFEAVVDICFDSMLQLESEGVFGRKTDERFLAIFFVDSDEEIMNKSVKALNTPKTFESFRAM